MSLFKNRHVLPSAAWVDGGNIQIPLKDIPARHRIQAFVIRFEAVLTTGAAAVVIPGNTMHRLISMIDGGPLCRASGQFFRFLDWQIRGAEKALPADLPATNSTAFKRWIEWVVPFYDMRAVNPWDDCPIGADYIDRVLSIDTAKANTLGAGTWSTIASAAGTLRVEAILAPPGASIGANVKLGFVDLTGQAPTLDAGLYTDLFVYRETAGTIDSTQITTAALSADGVQIADNVRLSEYCARYNDLYARGSNLQATSATTPIGGEMLPEAPSTAGAAADTVTVPFLPLIYPPYEYKKSILLAVEKSLRVDFVGSDTSFRVGYRRIDPHTEGSVAADFAKLGMPISSLGQVKTKDALPAGRAYLAKYLPLERR